MEEREKLARIEEKIDSIKENLNRVIEQQEKSETKFAGKWVEKFIIPTIILIISLFISNIVK